MEPIIPVGRPGQGEQVQQTEQGGKLGVGRRVVPKKVEKQARNLAESLLKFTDQPELQKTIIDKLPPMQKKEIINDLDKMKLDVEKEDRLGDINQLMEVLKPPPSDAG